MKAALFHGQNDIRVEDYQEEAVGPNDVRLDVATCGICGTDLHEYEGGPIFIPQDEPHPRTGASAPVPLGHEFSGVVSEVGENVTDLKLGDHVAIEPNMPCYECIYCEEGKYNLCPNFATIGLHSNSGGFAETAVVPANFAHKLPEDVSLEEGALVEPLAVGLHAVRVSELRPGDTIGIFGCGPIGLTVVQAASTAGAKEIFVSEPQDARRSLAGDLGADQLIDPLETDPVDYIKSETPDGVDCAIEFAGLETTFNAAVNSTKRDGTITVGSISEHEVSTDLNNIVLAERTVKGTFCYEFPPISFRAEYDAIISGLADGTIDIEPFVTGRISLDNIVHDGFEALLDEEQNHVKILVNP